MWGIAGFVVGAGFIPALLCPASPYGMSLFCSAGDY